MASVDNGAISIKGYASYGLTPAGASSASGSFPTYVSPENTYGAVRSRRNLAFVDPTKNSPRVGDLGAGVVNDQKTTNDFSAYKTVRRGSVSAASPGGSTANGPTGTGGVPTTVGSSWKSYRHNAIGGTSNATTNPTSIVGTPDGLGGVYDKSYVDIASPLFAGLTSVGAATSTSLTLYWTAASDQFTAQSQIVYDIYQSATAGGENFVTPTYTSLPGVTSYTVNGLNSSTTYYFVVRARDKTGNRDTNRVEKSGTTSAAPPTGGQSVYVF